MQLKEAVESFTAGQLSYHIDHWRQLTSDNEILQTILGEKIQFIAIPQQRCFPNNSIASIHHDAVHNEIMELVKKRVIVKCSREEGDFVSPIFTVPKKDGNLRLILNLKKLNEYVEFFHFKMEDISTILKLVRKGCWMTSIDLKDAYYSVKICEEDQKFLKFLYNKSYYMFTCYPNG